MFPCVLRTHIAYTGRFVSIRVYMLLDPVIIVWNLWAVARCPCVFLITVPPPLRDVFFAEPNPLRRVSPPFSQLIRCTRVFTYHYNMVYGLLLGRSWHNIQNSCLAPLRTSKTTLSRDGWADLGPVSFSLSLSISGRLPLLSRLISLQRSPSNMLTRRTQGGRGLSETRGSNSDP